MQCLTSFWADAIEASNTTFNYLIPLLYRVPRFHRNSASASLCSLRPKLWTVEAINLRFAAPFNWTAVCFNSFLSQEVNTAQRKGC